MTHPFETRGEITVDVNPDQVWEAIASGPGIDSWLMERWDIDSANKTIRFTMFSEVSSGTITVWEPGHRYAWQEDTNPTARSPPASGSSKRETAPPRCCAGCTVVSSAKTGRPNTTA